MSVVAELGALFDELVQRFARGQREDDVAAARADYDERRGRVFEDEDLWEGWTDAFLEWYVVERVPPGLTLPPAAEALAGESDPRRAAMLRAYLTSQRSLFEVRGLRAADVELLDVLGGARFSVAERRALHGVSTGDVIEVRLIGFEGEVHFGRTFVFHPSGTREAIVAHARRLFDEGQGRRAVIDYIAALRIKSLRYRHVSAVRLYEAPTAELAGARR